MKKIILSIICFISFFSYSEIIRVASFNALHLGTSKKDYKTMARIISKFDIIALEEVMNKNGLDRLVSELDNTYDYKISSAVGSKKYKEYYAVMYKKNIVEKVSLIGKYREKENEFIREPSAFYVKSNKLDFLLIPVHSIFGDNPKQRAKEASKYVDVYKYFKELTNQDDIIILGDFNLPATDKAFDNLKKENFSNILDPSVDKTTLSKKGLASSYDNIFINLNNTNAFTNRYGVYNFTKNNNEEIRKYISDHLLVFIEMDNKED
ncbi:endonuclease/exonuclease/phosphatase family protein [Oceanivirga miroungae]|uniref:Endonuclease/exonuclease/phosphatase n=1 Tax=Oceanivirga miroungae TaxID=1130046 RepID=A0A6I8M9Q8_9FUSO|nr:endonuclease/exonuclease/phosphatase family protein [Oceanivirga miroungae]VWL85026.1 endonuclease/exonuclease/phosphatase [Oceanivirga miroungae]